MGRDGPVPVLQLHSIQGQSVHGDLYGCVPGVVGSLGRAGVFHLSSQAGCSSLPSKNEERGAESGRRQTEDEGILESVGKYLSAGRLPAVHHSRPPGKVAAAVLIRSVFVRVDQVVCSLRSCNISCAWYGSSLRRTTRGSR